MKMQIPKTGNIIVDKTIGAKDISRSGNHLLDRTLNQNADGVQRTGNNLLDHAIHTVRGGNTLLSVNSKKGAALVNDRPNNLASKKAFKRGRYAGKEDES
jgi:hypothetical protein